MKGAIHSSETAGTLDGPGIRYVLFLHGCPFRCIFCHNPDTWATTAQKFATPQEAFDDIARYADFFKFSNGGTTISGGEPFVQKQFLLELLRLLKAAKIHSAIDTCGHIDIDTTVAEIVELADMFLLDIKHTDEKTHIDITGKSRQKTLEFLEYLVRKNKRIWLRCVLVEGISADANYAKELADLLAPYADKIERLELLPYHTLGVSKWKNLGLKYALADTPPTSADTINKFRQILLDNLKIREII